MTAKEKSFQLGNRKFEIKITCVFLCAGKNAEDLKTPNQFGRNKGRLLFHSEMTLVG